MVSVIEMSQVKIWINALVGKELNYITDRNNAIITSVDWDNDGGKLIISRSGKPITINVDRIKSVVNKLQKGHPVHVDTVLRSGSNDRTVIETIIANFPTVGFMKPNRGRNRSKNKVIQWMNVEIHPLGEILDVSDEKYGSYLLNAFTHENTQILSKPFVLLAGISGTGKTRFVREQAKASGSLSENYCLTSVRPDWHEPSDLLGYSSRLSGKTEYVITEVLQFIAKAWRAILDSGLTLSADYLDDYGDRLVVSGDKAQLDAVLPYWLCLDEMNLAPVEQYFADYLSVLETREWIWQDDDFQYLCDPLLKASIIHCMDDACLTKLRRDLEFADEQYNDAWELLCQHGIGIPFNLIVAGTVNMDETTHGFSRKVIDRALSFDFGCFFPNDFADYFAPGSYNQTLSYPIWSHAKESKSELAKVKADSSGEKSIRFLNEINKVLSNTPFELAYRALNELLLAVICSKPESGTQLNAVLDDFLMFKVLPRIEGDIDKLATEQTKQSILDELYKLLQVEFSEFWYEPKDSPNARPDLYRLKNTEDDKVLRIACRSKAKLEWMQKRLANSGFTSFWP